MLASNGLRSEEFLNSGNAQCSSFISEFFPELEQLSLFDSQIFQLCKVYRFELPENDSIISGMTNPILSSEKTMPQFTPPRPKLHPYFEDIFQVDRTEVSPLQLRLDVTYRKEVLGTETIIAAPYQVGVIRDEIESLIGRVRQENPWLPPPNYEILNEDDKERAHTLLRELKREYRKYDLLDLFEISLSNEAYRACVIAITDASDAIREKDPTRVRTIFTSVGELAGNSGVPEIERIAHALVAIANRILPDHVPAPAN
jgi:hypothetical protein